MNATTDFLGQSSKFRFIWKAQAVHGHHHKSLSLHPTLRQGTGIVKYKIFILSHNYEFPPKLGRVSGMWDKWALVVQ
jgi:hypothetical protein